MNRKVFSRKILIFIILLVIAIIVAAKNNTISNLKNSNLMHSLAINNNDNYIIESTQTKYQTLADAVAAANNGDKITLLQDTIDTSEVVITKVITLDVNSYTLRRGEIQSETDDTFLTNSKSILVNNGGVLNINGYGKIIGGGVENSKTIVDVSNNGTINVTNCTLYAPNTSAISCNSDNSENKAIANIEGGEINGNNSIYAGNNSIVNIKSGTIGYAPATYEPGTHIGVFINGGIVNIGDNSKELSINDPIITGGVYCSETDEWNFYNGIIYSYYSTVHPLGETLYKYPPKNIRENCKIEEATDKENRKIAYLIDETSESIENYKIEGSANTYSTLAAAVTAAENNDTIILLQNTIDDKLDVIITKKLILNTNEKTLDKGNNVIEISDGGILTIQGNGSIRFGGSSLVVSNGGTLNVNNGIITSDGNMRINNSDPYYIGGIVTPIAILCKNIEDGSQSTVNILGGNISQIYVIGKNSLVNVKGGIVEQGINNSAGVVNIGDKNGEFSTTNPELSSKIIISNDGTWNFYNGIIKGIDGTYSIEPSEIREGYEIYNIKGKEVTDITYLVEKNNETPFFDLSTKNGELKKGETLPLATIIGENYGVITVVSSDETIATAKIEENGLKVTGVKEGVATLTLTSSNVIDKTIKFKVTVEENNKRKIDIPTDITFNGNLIYNGNELTGLTIPESDDYDVIGNKATNAGKYTVTVSLKDKENTMWNDDTIEDKVIATYTIAKKKLDIPVAVEGLVFNGKEQIGVSEHKDYTIKGNKGTNVGTYEATVTLKDKENTVWNDETTEDIIIKWNILPREIEAKEEYEIKENLITNIQPNTNLEEFKTKIETTKEYEVLENEEGITDTDKMKTGQILKIGDKEYTIIVNGDADGDGKSDINDILKINKHRLNKANLKGAFLSAGDVDNDGNVGIKDILKINKFRLGKISKI